MPWAIIYVFFSFFLIATGMVLIIHGFPYVQNQVHEKIPPMVQDFFSEKVGTWFTITASTTDAYAANNPLEVEVVTGVLDLEEIKQIQLSFEGAQKAVVNKEPTVPDLPTATTDRATMNAYWTAMEKYREDSRRYWDEFRIATASNILFLDGIESYDKLVQREQEINSFTGQNISLPKYSRFRGIIQKLTYPTGGTFDIGITLTNRDGSVVGYGMTDLSYVIKDAIAVSPPEVLRQIESNNIMTGLGYIGIGIAPLIAGLVGLLEILKHFAFS